MLNIGANTIKFRNKFSQLSQNPKSGVQNQELADKAEFSVPSNFKENGNHSVHFGFKILGREISLGKKGKKDEPNKFVSDFEKVFVKMDVCSWMSTVDWYHDPDTNDFSMDDITVQYDYKKCMNILNRLKLNDDETKKEFLFHKDGEDTFLDLSASGNRDELQKIALGILDIANTLNDEDKKQFAQFLNETTYKEVLKDAPKDSKVRPALAKFIKDNLGAEAQV